jgi:hypothetical protein
MDIPEYQSAGTLTSEDIWAMFRETDRLIKEISLESKETTRKMAAETDRRMAETDRRIAETTRKMAAETDRRMAETDRRMAETDRQMAETDRRIAETTRKMAAETDRRIAEMDRLFKELALQSKETDRKISKLGSRIGELIENLVASNLLKKFTDRGFVFTKTCPNVLITNADNSFLAEIDILLENGDTALAVEVKSKLTVADVREHLERMEKLRRYADERGDRRIFIGAVAGGIIPEGVKPFAIKSGFFVIEQSGDSAVISVPDGFVPRKW